MPKNLNSRIQRIAEENPAQALLGHTWLFSFLPWGGMKSPCRRSAARSLGGAQRRAHLCSARGGPRAPRAAAKQPQAASAWRPRAATRRSSSDAGSANPKRRGAAAAGFVLPEAHALFTPSSGAKGPHLPRSRAHSFPSSGPAEPWQLSGRPGVIATPPSALGDRSEVTSRVSLGQMREQGHQWPRTLSAGEFCSQPGSVAQAQGQGSWAPMQDTGRLTSERRTRESLSM